MMYLPIKDTSAGINNEKGTAKIAALTMIFLWPSVSVSLSFAQPIATKIALMTINIVLMVGSRGIVIIYNPSALYVLSA